MLLLKSAVGASMRSLATPSAVRSAPTAASAAFRRRFASAAVLGRDHQHQHQHGHKQHHQQQPRRIGRMLGRTALVLAAASTLAYAVADPQSAERVAGAIVRNSRTTATLAVIAADYKWTLRQPPETVGPEAYAAAKSAVHKRSAERLLALFKANGGIYIKLGQHVSALVYLLPVEYTETMRVLQDQCPPSSMADVRALFRSDMGVELDDLFESFELAPLGVASLAQVHRATLKPAIAGSDGQQVAVKIQHPALDVHTPSDIAVCAFFVRLIKRVFPDFEFEWLAVEMQESLPKELDFVHEAANAERVRSLFAGSQLLRIPQVHWAKRRILVMEYIDGGKIDDRAYMLAHAIQPESVSTDLSRAYFEMIFRHGFVHCDPHPGNVFVRPRADRRPWYRRLLNLGQLKNFEIVLLDHGLYRSLSNSFRLDYAHFWDSLIRADEAGIEHYAYRLFLHDTRVSRNGVDHHRLFASMVSGRSWETITASGDGGSGSANGKGGNKGLSGLTSVRTDGEMTTVMQNAQQSRFLVAIADILAKLPSELLLLLKTNDLLRAVDESLGVSSGVRHMIKMVSLMGEYTSEAIRRETLRGLVEGLETSRQEGAVLQWPLWSYGLFWTTWTRYVQMRLWLSAVKLVA